MSDLGTSESWDPEAGEGGAAEGLSEEAKQRFAAGAAGMQQIRKEEKKSRKKDDQVAQVIIQFLGQKQYSHLFVLISRLVARDCPSVFILAILSLIHDGSKEEVERYTQERAGKTAQDTADESIALMESEDFGADANRALIHWITRMQLVLSLAPEEILIKLMVDDKNVDGTVLQLTTFVLQEYFRIGLKRDAPYEKVQPLTASILQTVFGPFMGKAKKKLLEQVEEDADEMKSEG